MASDKISITGERIRELYEDHGYSQKEFADFLGISTAQLRRYEKDPDQSIRSDLLITMAKHFHVSTDYLLGLTPVTKNNHELEHMHLTEAACEKLIRGEVSGDALSRLMEHEQFGELIEDITGYFDNSRAESIAVQAEMAALGASMIHKHAHEMKHPDIAHAAANGLVGGTADAQKIQLEDITSLLDSVLKDTKADIDTGLMCVNISLIMISRPAVLPLFRRSTTPLPALWRFRWQPGNLLQSYPAIPAPCVRSGSQPASGVVYAALDQADCSGNDVVRPTLDLSVWGRRSGSRGLLDNRSHSS